MEFKGTKGKWIKTGKSLTSSTFTILGGGNPKTIIAHVTTAVINRKDVLKPEEVEANAKLLAAAPELLEAAQAIVNIRDLIECVGDVPAEHESECKAINALIHLAEKAIEKALK